MPDPAEQLARIYQAGFEITQLELYPGTAAVVRDDVIALLRPTAAGLEMVGTPGWKIGESIGVLVEKDGRPHWHYLAAYFAVSGSRKPSPFDAGDLFLESLHQPIHHRLELMEVEPQFPIRGRVGVANEVSGAGVGWRCLPAPHPAHLRCAKMSDPPPPGEG